MSATSIIDDVRARTGPDEPTIDDVHGRDPASYRARIGEIAYELYDLIDDLDTFVDAVGPDHGADGSNGAGAIQSKVREAYGPLIGALQAARQADL